MALTPQTLRCLRYRSPTLTNLTTIALATTSSSWRRDLPHIFQPSPLILKTQPQTQVFHFSQTMSRPPSPSSSRSSASHDTLPLIPRGHESNSVPDSQHSSPALTPQDPDTTSLSTMSVPHATIGRDLEASTSASEPNPTSPSRESTPEDIRQTRAWLRAISTAILAFILALWTTILRVIYAPFTLRIPRTWAELDAEIMRVANQPQEKGVFWITCLIIVPPTPVAIVVAGTSEWSFVGALGMGLLVTFPVGVLGAAYLAFRRETYRMNLSGR